MVAWIKYHISPNETIVRNHSKLMCFRVVSYVITVSWSNAIFVLALHWSFKKSFGKRKIFGFC